MSSEKKRNLQRESDHFQQNEIDQINRHIVYLRKINIFL